ncbi:hypothetical protein B8Z58_001834 [Enterobacter roggenkampii]|nr:hypothetical protein [Enterobacter roggenkampii]
MSESKRQVTGDSMPKGLNKTIYERAAQQNSTPTPPPPTNTSNGGKPKQ